ncbi:MAG: hypothetical protein RL281_1399, partial [Pseudomonadota bacterium]
VTGGNGFLGSVVVQQFRAAGAMVGAPHKAEHLNVCHGDITVWTEAGMRRLTGYHVLPSLPGARPTPKSMRPGANASSTLNCSATFKAA